MLIRLFADPLKWKSSKK